MCLARVTKRIKKPTSKVREGYKVFRYVNNVLLTSVQDYKVRVDQWIKAERVDQTINPLDHVGLHYNGGFHVFISKSDAMDFAKCWCCVKVLKVRARFVHTIGHQTIFSPGSGSGKCFVAREINIPSQFLPPELKHLR